MSIGDAALDMIVGCRSGEAVGKSGRWLSSSTEGKSSSSAV